MELLLNYCRSQPRAVSEGWNRFWFTPTDPATLCLIRLFAGTMIFYTHLVWTLRLETFFGASGWQSREFVGTYFEGSPYPWSYLWWTQSPGLLWAVHLLALVVLAMFAAGLFSRVTSVLAFLITVAYINRVPSAFFGLDQINALLAMYVMLGPSGAVYSLDRWLARRKSIAHAPPVNTSISANVAIRLIQLHMCLIYLFAGCGKLLGATWWNGTAIWWSFASYEYQSIDMTWLAAYPLLFNFITHLALAWEVSYIALIWPRATRPIVIALAIPVHLGIAFCMGMITFGLVMLIGNLAFVSPYIVRALVERGRAGEEAENWVDEPPNHLRSREYARP